MQKIISIEEMKEAAKRRSYIEGIVALDISDYYDSNINELERTLSKKLTGSEKLNDIHYKIVNIQKDRISLRVIGDPTQLVFGCR